MATRHKNSRFVRPPILKSPQQQLTHNPQVTFQEDNARRRKSSFQTTSNPPRPKTTRNPSCFVHGFLQDHRLHTHHYQTQRDHPGINEDASMQSRLLTKREISDMAFGIRELSKRLSHFKLRMKVKSVFLLTKAHDEALVGKTRLMAEFLLSEGSGGPYYVYVCGLVFLVGLRELTETF